MSDVSESFRANLDQLQTWFAANGDRLNEATTRAHLIDRLFLECLGWNRNNVKMETPHDGSFADYVFTTQRPVLIVEAKREGIYFELPAGDTRVERSLTPLLRDNKDLKSAVEQVASYCQNRGVPYAAVTNGHQLVAFVATRHDGVPPLTGRALVFTSINDMQEHFLQLWNHLSFAGVSEDTLRSTLIGDNRPGVPPKLSASISSYPGIKDRNILQTDLQILSELILEDVIRNRDIEPTFLQECYSQSGALSQYALTSKSILEARYAALQHSDFGGPTAVPAVEKEGVSSTLLAESIARRPILLIGDVGVGKTTFWRHLVLVDTPELMRDSIVLYIDLGSQGTLTADLRTFVVQDIERQLLENYDVDLNARNFIRGVYNLDLERFRGGLYADLAEINPERFREKEIEFLQELVSRVEEHLRRSLEHLVKGRRKQIVVCLDNSDQRSDAIQQEAFLIAQEMGERWPATVFLALRPETFHKSLRSGVLSAYHPKAFTIAPPRIDRVLKKRLEFALRLTSGEIPVASLRNAITVNLGKLDTIIRTFLHSLDANRDLNELIDNVAAGNVRMALELVRDFFGSGHVDTQKILDICDSRGSYLIPLHEFLRAVLYGDSRYFDPGRSPIANLFDVSHNDAKEHFLLPILVSTIAHASGSNVREGFVETAHVYDRLQALGFTPEQIDDAINRAYRHKLIETEAREPATVDSPPPDVIRATTVGVYHIQRLCKQFTYVDAVIVDTPILDSGTRDQLQNVEFIVDRLDRAELFCGYLDQQWVGIAKWDSPFSWPEASNAVRSDLQRIRTRLASR